MRKYKVVLTTGGSGGHIFPAQATAEALVENNVQVYFITDKRGKAFQGLSSVQTFRLEAEHVMGRGFLGKLKAVFKLLYGAAQALFLLRKLKPDLIIGFGGYASFPAIMAGHLIRIPVVLHEQNSVLGRANRILAKGSRLIMTTFEKTFLVPEDVPVLWTGIPVRKRILETGRSSYPKSKKFSILIFGGSQGATFFSRELSRVFSLLPREIIQQINLVQQVRSEDKDFVENIYEHIPFSSLLLKDFFDDMPEKIKQANLVIGRAGASTIFETYVIGRPCVLFPLPTSADNHQKLNAQQVSEYNAWLFDQNNFDVNMFAKFLEDLIVNPSAISQKLEALKKLNYPCANEKIPSVIMDILKGLKD